MTVKNGPKNEQEIEKCFNSWKVLDHTRFMIARLREIELAEFGLTLEQAHVLDILLRRGGVTTINDIVDLTMRQHHSISTLVNRMAKRGLVIKQKNLHDSRKYNILITPKGQQLFEKTPKDMVYQVFSVLSSGEKNDLVKSLKQLLAKAYSLNPRPHAPNFPDELKPPKLVKSY